MAGLPVLKKSAGKIQNVVSSSDFEIFSPKIHPLATLKASFGAKIQMRYFWWFSNTVCKVCLWVVWESVSVFGD